MADAAPHRCFTVSTTNYLRNLSPEDRRAKTFAVHYQRAPEKTETGTSIGWIVPTLIVTAYLDQPEEVAQRVADILEKHWSDEDV